MKLRPATIRLLLDKLGVPRHSAPAGGGGGGDDGEERVDYAAFVRTRGLVPRLRRRLIAAAAAVHHAISTRWHSTDHLRAPHQVHKIAPENYPAGGRFVQSIVDRSRGPADDDPDLWQLKVRPAPQIKPHGWGSQRISGRTRSNAPPLAGHLWQPLTAVSWPLGSAADRRPGCSQHRQEHLREFSERAVGAPAGAETVEQFVRAERTFSRAGHVPLCADLALTSE